MPRRAFLADLDAATKVVTFDQISNVEPGNDDGEFVFRYYLEGGAIFGKLSAVIPELSDYPDSHDYHIFLSDDDEQIPPGLSLAVQRLPSLFGRPISVALEMISKAITDTLLSTNGIELQSIDASTRDVDEEDEEDENLDNEDWALDDDEVGTVEAQQRTVSGTRAGPRTTHPSLRQDLRDAKKAGFKVGILGTPTEHSSFYISIAIRVIKLGISEEAMDAWMLEASDYLLLLFHFPQGYRSLQQMMSYDNKRVKTYLAIRVALAKTYKPASVSEAQSVFNLRLDLKDSFQENDGKLSQNASSLRNCFISRPLNDLMNDRLVPILRYRLFGNVCWDTAERLFAQEQGHSASSTRQEMQVPIKPTNSQSLPSIVKRDDMADAQNKGALSLPLLSMQLLLRHFVTCTDFCLVCHCRVESTVEAIKPYVCDNSLCLYQYMTLGFGPSIEHEILTQPFVVDLLVSLCYSAVESKAINNVPKGLGWKVPNPALVIAGVHLPSHEPRQNAVQAHTSTFAPPLPAPARTLSSIQSQVHSLDMMYEARFNSKTRMLHMDVSKFTEAPAKQGDWIVVNMRKTNRVAQHYQVIDTSWFPDIRLGHPIDMASMLISDVNDKNASDPDWFDIDFHIYDTDFDEILDQNSTMRLFLLLMPSISEMRRYLLSRPGQLISLWTERLPPPVWGFLRWILASNRSCIMQVDNFEVQEKGPLKAVSTGKRVQGVQQWAQFKFAMGAPDKEQRFLNSVQEETASLDFPTLFAWHGSPLQNWHSIVREGLHFKKIAHGRAFGNGCYHAKDFDYSSNYVCQDLAQIWPRSELKISGAIALNEIVNAPRKFVNSQTHYVVDKLDWIQTRYLFVKLSEDIKLEKDGELKAILPQHPERTPLGPGGQKIILPESAIPRSRALKLRASKPDVNTPRVKRNVFSLLKARHPKPQNSITSGEGDVDVDTESVATEELDLAILNETDEISMTLTVTSRKNTTESVTKFIPRQSVNTTKLLPPPYAARSASKRLQKDFTSIRKTQEKHLTANTLDELGWYIDIDHFSASDNLYQWIFELHSFPLSLPLAQDLQRANLQSVTLEFRFNEGYPSSPPFIRVVKPRFLPFAAGGGGHVTAGGSMCMELLTATGWSPANDIESVLLQIRMAILSTDPRPARLQNWQTAGSSSNVSEKADGYDVTEAISAFKRSTILHGWKVPDGIDSIAW